MTTPEKPTTNGHRILIGVLAILIGITPLICKSALLYDFSNLPQSAYLQTISIIFLIIFFLNSYFNRQLNLKWSVFYIPIFGLLIWSFLSLFWSTNVPEGLAVWLNWLAAGILFFVIYNLIRDTIDIKIFLFLSVLPTIFIVLVGLNQFLETSLFDYPQIIGPAVTFGNKNMMIDALIPLLPVALYLTIQNHFSSLYIKIFGAFLYGAGVVLVLLSETRAGILAIAFQLFFYLIGCLFLLIKSNDTLKLKKRFIYINSGALLLSLLLFFSTVHFKNEINSKRGVGNIVTANKMLERVKTIFQTKAEDQWVLQKGNKDIALKPISDSRTMRLVTWQNTLVMFLDRPILGFGLFNWQIHYGEYRNAYWNDPVYRPGMSMVEVHNDYLQILVDLGIPGALLALFLMYLNVYSLIRIFIKGNEEDIKLAIILGLGLFGIHLVALFSFPFERSVPIILFFLYSAFLAFYKDNLSKVEPQKIFSLNAKGGLAFALILFFLLIGVIFVQNRRLLAEVEYKAGYDQHASGNYDLAINHAKKTLELNPYRYTAYFLMGYSYLGLNKLEDAEKTLLKGLEYYPNDLNSLLQIGTTYTKLTILSFAKNRRENQEVADMVQKANYWFDKALQIRDDFHTIYFNKGVVNWQKSYYAKANKEMEKSEEYRKLAIENYKKSIEYNPAYIDGLTTVAQLLFEGDQKKEAVIYADKAIAILLANFENAEKEMLKMDMAKVLPTSPHYIHIAKKRRRARQDLIASIHKSLAISKAYYGAIEVNFAKYLEIVIIEEKYLIAKNYELQDQFYFAENVLSRNESLKVSDPKVYANMVQELENKKTDLRNFKLEKQLSFAILGLNKAEVYQNMQNYEAAMQSLSMVLNTSEKVIEGGSEAYYNELKTCANNAHLNMADILCILSTVDNASKNLNPPKFMELEPKIDSHLKLVKAKEGDRLYQKFIFVTTKFLKLREVASKLKNNK